ncbi:MAG: RiPP maturation radical SAM C-methyltransferase [Archangiaceae bacterium]|nr:RiPP maturation radical SAM C-methyltransferase [Archangiaceae bacterium]
MKPAALVSMPTLSPRFPSFQLALLQATLAREGIASDSYSLFMYFAKQVGWALNESLATMADSMIGEWIWSRAAFGAFSEDDGYFAAFPEEVSRTLAAGACTLDELRRLREVDTAAFVEHYAATVNWAKYGLVGFSICFQQLNASLAMAKAIKRRYPTVPIVFGGSTFEDDIAREVMTGCPQVDVVHCGDADEVLPELARRLAEGASLEGLRGPMWREAGGVLRYEGRAPNLDRMDKTPVPDFDEYFQACQETGFEQKVMLPIETARGCWHGMKNHCTFCGLNRQGMNFRAKSPDAVLELLRALSDRYGVFNFNAIDNIVSPEYVDALFARLAEQKSDFRLHYEIRSNLSREKLKQMVRGGVYSVQPGIESFSTHVLSLMKKFTTGIRNIELLKWTSYYGVENLYILLCGFHGETEADYRQLAEVLPKLVHFQPPVAMGRARADRGSPMFERPAQHGVKNLRPARCYPFIFPAERFDLTRVSYYFEHDAVAPLPEEVHDACIRLVDGWRARWHSANRPWLRYAKGWRSLTISDGRGATPREVRLRGEVAELYELCAEARRAEDVRERLGDPGWLDEALAELVSDDLLLHLDGRYLALALPANANH